MSNYIDYVTTPNYCLGEGALKTIKKVTLGFGKRFLIVTACGPITDRVVNDIQTSFATKISEQTCPHENRVGEKPWIVCSLPIPDVDYTDYELKFLNCEGQQVTMKNAECLAQVIRKYQPDCIVACGGGKALDLVRGATFYVDMVNRPKIVLVPTSIASNACATSLSVIYNEDGTEILDMWRMLQFPEAVIVDTSILITAPVRTLIAGIGDQLTCSLEGIHNLQEIGEYGTAGDIIGQMHADVCRKVLMKYGVAAVRAAREGKITHEFEWVVTCITHFSGAFKAVSLGYLSHQLDEIMIDFEPVSKLLHGEVVGWGVLPEMYAFGTPERIYEFVKFYQQIGIPCTLEELGIPDVTEEALLRASEKYLNSDRATINFRRWKAADIVTAVLETDKLVRTYLEKKK